MTGTEHEVGCGAAETATSTRWLTMTAGTGAKAAWSDTAEIYGPHSPASATRGQGPPRVAYPSLVTRPASMNSSRIERWSRTYLPSFT